MTSRLDCLIVNAPSRIEVYGDLAPIASCEPPVWGGLIAQYLLNQGYSVEMLDAEARGMTCETTALEIETANPRLAVFPVYGHQPSASTQCMPAASKVSRGIAPWSRVRTLVLGTHASALPLETLKEGCFDYVVQGEGPGTIAHVLFALAAKEEPKDIPGLWHYVNGSQVASTPPAPVISNLDAMLPRQAWQLLDMKRYRPLSGWDTFTTGKLLRGRGYASVQTSLGCPFRCAFCCINAPFGGAGIRFWSAKNVVDQIEELVEQHGITTVKIPDEMFLLNPRHVTAICEEIIARHLGDFLNMWAYARIDTVKDDALLALARRAGFTRLGIGIESGSKLVRDGVEKGRFGNEEIAAAIGRVHAHGLHVGANYIFGLPDDTQESILDTFELSMQLNTMWANFYCAMAYPGSALHRSVAKHSPHDLPEAPDGPGWIGYSQHAYESKPLPTETLTYQEVLDLRDRAFLIYYDRPNYQRSIESRFGSHAIDLIDRMLLRGMPKRKHRETKQ